MFRRGGVWTLGGTGPAGKRALGDRLHLGVGAVARDDQRGIPGPQIRSVKCAHVVHRQRGERGVVAQGRVPVGMRPVQQPHERAVRDGARHVLQLHEAVQA